MKVSVIICTYNYVRFLPQCLESVVSQTRPPDEVIVVDDGSEDGTAEAVRRFDGVRYIRQGHAGKAAAFNRGFLAARGDLICHLDADDFWMPEKLERVSRALRAVRSAGGLIHEVVYVDAGGNPVQAVPSRCDPVVCSMREVLLSWFTYLPRYYRRAFGSANSICAWRGAIEDLFPLPPEIGLRVDGALLGAAARHGLLCWPDPLSAYRHHGGNYFVSNASALREGLIMLRWLISHPGFGRVLPKRERELLHAKLLEDTLICCLKTDLDGLEGFWAGVRLWRLLGRQGVVLGWKHVAAPAACFARGFFRRVGGAAFRGQAIL